MSRPALPPRPALRRTLLVAVPVTALCVGIGVAVSRPSPQDQASPKPPAPTTLADVDTTTMPVRRAAFCDRVPPTEVKAALGGVPTRTTSYDAGQTAPLTPTVRDVAGEFDCTWSTRVGASASGWVFATAVTAPSAQALTATPKGCRAQSGPDYGRPSVALACTDHGRTTVSLRGLFGDAWLSCSLTGTPGEPAPKVTARADRWCLTVAQAAS